MDIIARLREEREALVARLAQIDKMLLQYEEWGREAQNLLSLTSAVASRSLDPVRMKAEEGSSDASAPVRKPVTLIQKPMIRRVQLPHRSQLPFGKTPMPQFEDAVIEILRESGTAMDRVALYDALTARGVVIGTGDRDKDLNALSARAYRMAQDPKNRISGERGQGYRLLKEGEATDNNIE